MMTFRSFLPSVEASEGIFARYINTRYGVASLRELSLLLLECLVYGRETTIAEIMRHYSVVAPKVSATEWNTSADTVRRAGKDAESKKIRYVEKIRDALSECEEVYSMLAMRYDSVDYVRKAFDEQWRVINKRRQDGSDIYERDYLAFIDECLSYFFSVFAPFINGTSVSLVSSDGNAVEESLFSPQYFQTELVAISNAHGEIFQKRSSGLTNTITRAEAKRIAAGQIPSLREIETLIKVIGSSFYSIGKILQKTLSLHKETLKKGQIASIREPLRHLEYEFDGGDLIVPYYDYRFGSHDKHNASQKMLVGMRIVSNAVKDGIINSINAFCYQFSQEFFDRSIANDLDYRKDLLKKIEEAERR
jgi:hypothetical protein